jgi:hypothetical protein
MGKKRRPRSVAETSDNWNLRHTGIPWQGTGRRYGTSPMLPRSPTRPGEDDRRTADKSLEAPCKRRALALGSRHRDAVILCRDPR